jgi:hypothetical protein
MLTWTRKICEITKKRVAPWNIFTEVEIKRTKFQQNEENSKMELDLVNQPIFIDFNDIGQCVSMVYE